MLRRCLPGLACVLLLAGCGGGEDGGVPAACKEGEEAVRAALKSAPGEVRLNGTPLSGCLTEDADGEDLQVVGTGFVEAAAGLAPAARREPNGRAALELGYLVAAARRGSSSSQGVNSELVRRLEQELELIDTRTPAFRRGARAGRRSG